MDLPHVVFSSIASRLGVRKAAVGQYSALMAILAGLLIWWIRNRTPERGRLVYKFQWNKETSHAGQLIGECLKQHGVKIIFTLCGGHISPILVGAKQSGIKVVDVRNEANAAFAADAYSRLSGVPGVCAVTAGPGLSNVITAVKNAQLAQTPMIVFGGATSGLLKGRHSLQDVDQFAMMKPHVKWSCSVGRVRDVVASVELAFFHARSGTPGPVFVEFPMDVIYDENSTRRETSNMLPRGKNVVSRLLRWGVGLFVTRIYSGLEHPVPIHAPMLPLFPTHTSSHVSSTLSRLKAFKRPMLILGSQCVLNVDRIPQLVEAIHKLGFPTWLQGMCRGLLGAESNIYIKHHRGAAFHSADGIIICGVPFDFRVGYGMGIPLSTQVIAVNRDRDDLYLNSDLKFWQSPSLAVHGASALPTVVVEPDDSQWRFFRTILCDPAAFLVDLAAHLSPVYEPEKNWGEWRQKWCEEDRKKAEQHEVQAAMKLDLINPIRLCLEIDKYIAEDSILIGDGGDFVATVAHNIRPRKPLSWLDPGLYGTLGIGAGFALAAKLLRPNDEVWLFWGDGACGFSLIEFDTFRRFNVPIIAVVGNDACWAQILRGQEEILKDSTGCLLEYTRYDEVARALGCEGLLLEREDQIAETLQKAKLLAAQGKSVLINAMIGRSDFRKGSLSF